MKREMALLACAIVASAGTSAGAQVIDWASPVDGNWNVAGNWVGGNVPNAVGEDAVLGMSGAYMVTISNNFTHGSLSIFNPDATLGLVSIYHRLNGDLFNNGTIIINVGGTVFNTHIGFEADAAISGSGEIVLNGNGSTEDAQVIVTSPFTLTHMNGHTIRGAGRLNGDIVNQGVLVGDNVIGGLEIVGTLTQTAGGTAGAVGDGTFVLGSGSVVSGGAFVTTSGGAVVKGNGTSTIGGLTNSGDLQIPSGSGFLNLNANVVNNGTITVNSDSSVFNAHIQFVNNATLNGTGDVVMISVGDLADAQILTSAGITGTIGINQTVSGSGQIIGDPAGGLIFNRGTINGNDAAVGLGIGGNHLGTGGVYRSDNGTLLLLTGLVLDGGTFESSGTGSITKDTGGIAKISNVTNNGQLNIWGKGGSIELGGTLVNNGTLSINSDNNVFNAHLRTSVDVAIGGDGVVQMTTPSDRLDAQIFTDAAVMLTIGENQTVMGSGRIGGDNDGIIENLGVINGNHAAAGKEPAFELLLEGNHTGNNLGVYRSDNGLLTLGNGLALDHGTFDSSGDGIVDVANNSSASVSDVTNLGHLGIRGNGSFLRMAGPVVNNGTLSVNSNANIFNAHLVFETASAELIGNGTVRMQISSDFNDAQIFTNGAFDGLIGSGQFVGGSGQIDGRNGGTIVNTGVIDGDDPINELRLYGNHDGSGGGIYQSTGGVLGMTSGVVMNGGTFETSAGGSVAMVTTGVALLSDMVNNGTMDLRGAGGIVEIDSPLTNNGTININSDANIFNAHIRFQADTVIDGVGNITMVTNNNSNDAQIIAASGFTGTIGSGQSVSGDGLLVGNINLNGVLDPGGTTRTMNIDALTLSASSELITDLGGLAAGEFDRLLLANSDTIDLDGTLTVNLDDGYVPMFLDTWEIVDGGTVNGEFATTFFPPSAAGLEYKVIYEPSRVFVVLTCAADLTGDGTLNFLDVSTFLGYFGNGDVRGDINGDGSFNFLDVSLFLQIYSGVCGG
tara:strand:+ start:186851 stop:189880 length:3030 start_codon:yes stop_codon:yes gene_type:complete